jgi:peptide/nickel transport system ATP-binding protein
MDSNRILLEVQKLKKYFTVRKGILKRVVGYIKAVDDINFFIKEGETLGLVGESGCGKTTAGRTILNLTKPTGGKILFRGKRFANSTGDKKVVEVIKASSNVTKSLRRDMQIIFQDPYSSLDPRMTIRAIVGEPLRVHKLAKRNDLDDRVQKTLAAVGLNPEHMKRYPHQFSGGQRQRISIARALILEPEFIVADEPVSALDVSIQAQVVNLLQDLQEQFRLTFLFIAHNLSVIKYISDRVAVMYLGKIIELAEADALFMDPRHPYTEALMSAVPVPNPQYKVKQILLKGDVPSPLNPPSGCYFHPRCQYAKKICSKEIPPYRDIGNKHFVSCHFSDSLHLQPIRTM